VRAKQSDRQGVRDDSADDVAHGDLEPGKILSVQLISGQHFVDLRDAAGRKLWQKVVAVPAGSQITEQVETEPTTNSLSEPSQPSTPNPDQATQGVSSADYLTGNEDPTAAVGAVADYLKRKGLKVQVLAPPNGGPLLTVAFRSDIGTFVIGISFGGPLPGHPDQAILGKLKLHTQRVVNISDQFYRTLEEASYNDVCAWHIDPTENGTLICQTVIMFNDREAMVPISQITGTMDLMVLEWTRLYPKVQFALK